VDPASWYDTICDFGTHPLTASLKGVVVSSSLPYADYMKAKFADISEALDSLKSA
jgi:hypothetical protein